MRSSHESAWGVFRLRVAMSFFLAETDMRGVSFTVFCEMYTISSVYL